MDFIRGGIVEHENHSYRAGYKKGCAMMTTKANHNVIASEHGAPGKGERREDRLVKRIMYCKSCGRDLTPPLTVVEGHTSGDAQSNRRRRRGRSRLRKPSRDDTQPVLEDERNPMPDGMAYNSHVPYDERGVSKGGYMTIAPQIWMNLNDLLGDPLYTPHTERLDGCCGPCGADGPNRICRCGAHIGTEMSDCGTPRMFIPDPATTAWRDAMEQQ
jgi:hypothetical protein